MRYEYVKYRRFIREFTDFLEGADEDVVYEIVGRGGVTIGYFSINRPT